MTQQEMADLMEYVFKEEIQFLREEGQKEYAHEEDNAFRNFETIASYLNLDRKKVLLTYAIKHLDGIVSHVNGHTSQREDIRGRINDLIVYMFLLRGMIEEEDPTLEVADVPF